jgi:hypothetical protein
MWARYASGKVHCHNVVVAWHRVMVAEALIRERLQDPAASLDQGEQVLLVPWEASAQVLPVP